MYDGEWSEELKEAYREYYKMFGEEADAYEEINGCIGVEHDDFLNAIKKSLRKKKRITKFRW